MCMTVYKGERIYKCESKLNTADPQDTVCVCQKEIERKQTKKYPKHQKQVYGKKNIKKIEVYLDKDI